MFRFVVFLLTVLSLAACGVPGPMADRQAMDGLARSSTALPDGSRLSYLHAGDPQAPRIILVHGTPGDAQGWADYLLHPPAGTYVVAVDRPGFGESGPDGAVPSLTAQAAAIATLLKTSDGRKPVLVGHSLGAPIVTRIAADYPDQVGALVLAAGSLDPDLEEIHWAQYLGRSGIISWALPRAIRNANEELLALKPQLETLKQRIPMIRTPIIVIHGDQDDLVPIANVTYMQAMFRTSPPRKIMELKGMNHFLPWRAMPEMRAAIASAMQAAWGPQS